MPSTTVQFFGICTHVEPESIADAPTDLGHRVILVNADRRRIDHFPVLEENHVDPHIGILQIRKSDLFDAPPHTSWFPMHDSGDDSLYQWKLEGVRLRIANAEPWTGAPLAGTCMPSLSNYLLTPPIPALFDSAEGAHRDRTYCYFDFPSVSWSGKKFGKGAAVGIITVGTSDTPVLEVKPFDSEEVLTFSFKPDAQITVFNFPTEPTEDKDPDFLLHYLVTGVVAHDTGYPVDAATIACTGLVETNNPPVMRGHHFEDTTGPGCSNSLYP